MTEPVSRAAVGAGLARLVLAGLTACPPGGAARWRRTNHRGATVTLLTGPALAIAVASTSRARGAAGVAGLGAAVLGRYDDAAGGRDDAKGFRGHLLALRHGRLTAGAVKLVGISGVGVLAATQLQPRRRVDALLGGAVVAGSANLLNLLDLRPGRALKVGLLAGLALGEPGVAGSCAAVLPSDLTERTMLGDAGANALGAVLGVGLLRRVESRSARVAALVALAGLTAASERVSFSSVIDATPPLRWLDQLGRRA